MESEIGTRLRHVRKTLGETQKSMSERLELGPSTWQKIERGISLPSGDTLLKIGDLGFSLDWILLSKGQMQIVEDRTPLATANVLIDPTLFGRITDAVATAYKEMNTRISAADLGTLSAEKYSEIMTASDSPAEWPGMVKLMAAQLRKELTHLRS